MLIKEQEVTVLAEKPGAFYNDLIGISGARYDRASKGVAIPKNAMALEDLMQTIGPAETPDWVKAIIRQQRHREERVEALRTQDPAVATYDYPVKATLFQHQVRAANMAMETFDQEGCGGFAFLLEMGLGKTLCSIAVMGAMAYQGRVQRVLICAPTSVCGVWREDLAEFAKFPYACRVLAGDKKKRLAALEELEAEDSPVKVAVINYESTFREGMFEALQSYNADIIICDESQRIKSPKAKQAKALHALGDVARYRLILTGTPVQNQAIDFWSQYRFCDPRVFGKNYYAFRARYCRMGGYQNHQIVGYNHLDELTKKAHSIALRATKAECLDLPPQTFRDIRLPLEGAERRLYDAMRQESITQLEGGQVTAPEVLTRLLRLQQITGGFLTPDGEERPRSVNRLKLSIMGDILGDYVIGEGQSLVVFARFLPELAAIEAMCHDMGISCARLDGSVPMHERPAMIEDFQEGRTQVFLAQIATAGLGITLTRAKTAVFYSWDFNYATYQQALARIHRIGQTEPVTYIHLIAEDTIDDKVLKALKKKEDLATRLVDNWRELLF